MESLGTHGVFALQQPAGESNELALELLLDDFDDRDAFLDGNGRENNWYQYDDGTSTQLPTQPILM